MNPASEDIKDILVSSSVGIGAFAATSGWSIHIGGMPDGANVSDTCISLLDTGGGGPEANYVYQYPTVQVLVRGAIGSYKSAYTKAEEIRDALHSLINESWSSTRYIQILCISDIAFITRDDKKRPVFSVNFIIHRT